MTTPNARWTAGLTAVAAIAIAFGAWAKVDTEKLRAVNGPAAVAEDARQPTPRPGADANGLPEIPAARPSARPSDPTVRGGDRDGNRISDILESRLGGAAPGERFDVIVMFDRPDPVGRARGAVGDFPLGRQFSIINGFQAEMTAAQIRALSALPGVVRIEENIEVRAHDIYANRDTGVTEARPDFGVTGLGVTICVLDTGINPDHELFDTKGLSAADFADFTSNATQPYDDHFHGSHVSGIAAGDGTPFTSGGSVYAESAIGVAPDANLKVGKVLDANGSGSSAQIIDGLAWCANQSDVQIINMSLGGAPTDGNDPISVAANCAADPSGPSCGNFSGTPKIVVVSAGNSGAELGTVGTPGVAAKAITVASFAEHSGDPAKSWQDDGDHLNPFSSRGAEGSVKPDIASVGSRVLSAYVNDPANPSPTAYAVASGTSMSSPHVAGIVALMIEADPSLAIWDGSQADLPYAKVRDILKDTAVDVGPPGDDLEYGAGLVDAYAAVATAAGAASYTPTAYPLSGTQVSGTVPDNGSFEHLFTITPEQVGLPVAAMMTIDGQITCSFWCIVSYWDPDLELIVEQDTGSGWQQVTADTNASPEVTHSTCPEGADCGSVGRVELVHFIAKEAGNYRFRVYPFDANPNAGKGGDFTLDISMPTSGTDGNDAPTASIDSPTDGSSFTEEETIGFVGSASDTEDGDLTSGLAWSSDLDGAFGTGGSVSTSALSIGRHTITASVTDSGSQTGSDSITVDVTDTNGKLPPSAGFSSSTSGLTAEFTDSSTDSDGTVDAWSWDFGDSNSSTAQNPSHTYASSGTYTVTLTVTDDDLATDSVSQSVTVEANDPPVASFTISSNPCGEGALIDNRCSFYDTSTDSDGEIQTWDWDFGSGTVAGGIPLFPGHEMLVDFPADGPNPETVTLTVTDNAGATHTASMEVWLSNVAPSADFAFATSDLTADFTDASTDSDGNVTGWSWNFGDGNTSTAQNPSHTYASGGTYTVTLVATDNDGANDSASQDVSVSAAATNSPPTADFTFTTSDLTADFTDASTDSDGNVTGWSWDFGDGATSTAQSPSHTYASGDTYTVTLTVTDDDGATDGATQPVSVSAPADGITLTATPNKARGRHHTILGWSGATSKEVDVYRDGQNVYFTANDGDHIDETNNRGGATYTFQICEKDTSTCSNVETVVY